MRLLVLTLVILFLSTFSQATCANQAFKQIGSDAAQGEALSFVVQLLVDSGRGAEVIRVLRDVGAVYVEEGCLVLCDIRGVFDWFGYAIGLTEEERRRVLGGVVSLLMALACLHWPEILDRYA